MGWSSDDLDACPAYRRVLWTQFLFLERRVQAEQAQKRRRRSPKSDEAAARREVAAARQRLAAQEGGAG